MSPDLSRRADVRRRTVRGGRPITRRRGPVPDPRGRARSRSCARQVRSSRVISSARAAIRSMSSRRPSWPSGDARVVGRPSAKRPGPAAIAGSVNGPIDVEEAEDRAGPWLRISRIASARRAAWRMLAAVDRRGERRNSSIAPSPPVERPAHERARRRDRSLEQARAFPDCGRDPGSRACRPTDARRSSKSACGWRCRRTDGGVAWSGRRVGRAPTDHPQTLRFGRCGHDMMMSCTK